MDKSSTEFGFLLICGIPGVGKTYFSKALYDKLKTYFKFDNITYLNSDDRIDTNVDYKTFKRNIVEEVNEKSLNCLNNQNNSVFIIEDNFYYLSMRKPFYKLIDTYSHKHSNINFFYLEIHLLCTLEYALKNNNTREGEGYVEEKVIKEMFDKYEDCSFNNCLILKIPISQENCVENVINKTNLIEILHNKIADSKSHLKILKQASDALLKEKSIEKSDSAKYIDEIEIAIRKEIQKFYSENRIQDKVMKNFIINLKKEFISYLKNDLHNRTNEYFEDIDIYCKYSLLNLFKIKLQNILK